jgi:CubicO group peptidase (beta-lactamase class C family)
MIYYKKWIFWIGAFISFSVFAEPNTKEELVNKNFDKAKTNISINKIVDNYVSSHALDGGVILIAKAGEIIYEEAYGLAEQSINKPITTNSSFQVASLSKPITATLILKLEEQGKLKLDSTLADYFPEFNTVSGKKITLHHLLSHTSGIPNHFVIDGWFNTDFHKDTSEQEFVNIIAKQSPVFEPGEDYLYSNPAYFLLGKVIEKATNESYSVSMQKHIFAPLNMVQSGIAVGFQSYQDNVKGYQWKSGGGYREQIAKNMSLFGAGAGIFTSAQDLYRFDSALYGNVLLKDKSKKRLFDPHHPYSWRIGRMPINEDLDVNVYTYDGKFDGYSAMITRFIDDKHSIIILSNTGISYFLKEQLTHDIATVLYGQDAPNRQNDTTLALIKSIVVGNFSQALNEVQPKKNNLDVNEQSLSSLAFGLLWSNIANDALQLFSVISDKFPNSLQAQTNLQVACNHQLAKSAKSRDSICS